MAVRVCAAASALLLAAGCGTDAPPPRPGETLTFGSLGTRAEIDCQNGKSLRVDGSNNTLAVRGTCASVRVEGADNRITVERISAALSVAGVNNTVSYAEGEPDVTDTGTGSRIFRG